MLHCTTRSSWLTTVSLKEKLSRGAELLKASCLTPIVTFQVMETLRPVLKQIAIRPGTLRQPTIKEFFKRREITEEEKVAKIRSKRMEKVILHMKEKDTEVEECAATGTEISQNKPSKRTHKKERRKRPKH